ncbi:dihydroorotase family protein [uncultured Ilumatobacter sp.]|uniref:dihydroorotase n=1 Tax=uncultured Ilumatobacter sp. TaxID=879968 RepID=UPI00374F3D22
MTNVIVAGGTIVSSSGRQRADLALLNGRVVAVGRDLPAADLVIDATDLLVLPGGVDTHVHLMEPGDLSREDYPSGTAAAAARGVTTIIEHTHGHPIREVEDLHEKKSHLVGRANVDYALAAHTWPDRVDRIPDLWRAGVAFFKIFTCSTHGVPGLDPANLLAALRAISDAGAAALIHCEDESITAVAERALKESGRTDNGILLEWRSREAELAATAAAASLVAVTGARATIAHVSSPAVAAVVTDARARGGNLAAEACPQYLLLREDEVHSCGSLRKFTPPARARSDADEDAMWDLVRNGTYSHFSTDHAPSTMEQKQSGDIWTSPFGLPGLDTTFPVLVDAALRGKIDLADVARLYCETPAKRYGLFPRKGHLGVGADADFVLIDAAGSWRIDDSSLLSKAGWSPYDGRVLQGRAVATYLGGKEVARDGAAHQQRTGSFVDGAGRLPAGVR